MNNDYQIGKDIGEILGRLKKLENEDCGCGGRDNDTKEEEYDNDDELQLTYAVHPMLEEKAHVSIMIRKGDELSEFFTQEKYAETVSFVKEESENFFFYSTVTSIAKIEALRKLIVDFLNNKEDFISSKHTYKCTFWTQRTPSCRGRSRKYLRCKSGSDAWNICISMGNSTCPHILEKRGRCN